MAARKSTSEESLDLDDLLSLTEDDLKAPEPLEPKKGEVVEHEVEDEDDARIRALQEELSKPAPKPYKPAEQRTEKEQKIADLEDQLARKREKELDRAEVVYDDADDEEGILFHILEDGFTFNGLLTYKGQEFLIVPGSKAYEDTKDRFGNTWLDLVDDVDAQYDRWGSQKIGAGPWNGRKWGDTKGLSAAEAEESLRAEKAERQRNRRPPTL